MRVPPAFAGLLCILLAMPLTASAQADPPRIACRDVACHLILDWGSGASAASYGADRRYGAASDLERLLKEGMMRHGLRTGQDEGAVITTIRVRMARAICDQLPGTSTDRSCQTVDELNFRFSSSDSTVKVPGGMRIANRCGSGDMKMTVAQMAEYAVDFLAWQLAPDKTGLKKAIARC